MIFLYFTYTTEFPVGGDPDFRTTPPPQRAWMTGTLLSYSFAGPRQYMSDKYDFCVCLQLGMNVIFKKP